MALSYLRRDEWGAVKPLKWNDLQLPLYHVYYIATQTRECSDELTCIKVCQRLQSIHLMKKYGDIRFSFMIGGDGQVYEGRGWKYAPSLPIEYRDRNQQQSILIAFIGRWMTK
ncbi:peptidoglycan recognition protein-like isoform X2 [Macrosteles quadrilineatus]|uniref:peptidoglycan recognition protein-like isoform X2 n=1 Tax=Macrosteles quadrilineatus TaxID=74068 RepID=UPI0023E113F4|nr:peptidoglycan recognition protein-like isoform X2 [Macrosteles quadrilineatus]